MFCLSPLEFKPSTIKFHELLKRATFFNAYNDNEIDIDCVNTFIGYVIGMTCDVHHLFGYKCEKRKMSYLIIFNIIDHLKNNFFLTL